VQRGLPVRPTVGQSPHHPDEHRSKRLGNPSAEAWGRIADNCIQRTSMARPSDQLDELRTVTPRAQRDEPGVVEDRSKCPHGRSLRTTPACERLRRASSFLPDSVSTHSLQRENRRSPQRHGLLSALRSIPTSAPERPFPLAIDQQLAEGPVPEPSTCLWPYSRLAVSPREGVSLKEGRQNSLGDEWKGRRQGIKVT
jgi:hypothetical protein